MHPVVFREFDRICGQYNVGGDVLELGVASSRDSLLRLPSLASARSRTGVNVAPVESSDEFHFVQANANDLRCFPDASFDTVLSNSMLEHDPFFWKSLAEMKRVIRPGGIIVIGVPGYAKLPLPPVLRSLLHLVWPPLAAAAPTLQTHSFPGDYYRFGAQAMREVFFEGMRNIQVSTVLAPPRFVGAAITPPPCAEYPA